MVFCLIWDGIIIDLAMIILYIVYQYIMMYRYTNNLDSIHNMIKLKHNKIANYRILNIFIIHDLLRSDDPYNYV